MRISTQGGTCFFDAVLECLNVMSDPNLAPVQAPRRPLGDGLRRAALAAFSATTRHRLNGYLAQRVPNSLFSCKPV